MAMFSAPGAYDRAITVFSPDGRLFQVEYAYETVKKGSTVLGITCPEGVVLAAEERIVSKLQDPNFTWKIFQIDDHMGAAISGLSSDARLLIDQARIYAQSNRLMYDEIMDVDVLSKRVGDIMQIYTQHAGVRPFGVSIIFGGVDKSGSRIIQTDPSGTCYAYKAVSAGIGSEKVKEILEAKYDDKINLEDAILLAIESVSTVIEGGIEAKKIKVAIIPTKTKKFTNLKEAEIEGYLEKLKS